MDNSMASTPYSTLKGDAYRAYEALPPEVRLALQEALVDWCPLRAREWHLHLLRTRKLRPAEAAAALVQAIRGHDHAEVTAFARRWPQGAAAYPHLAAEATLQRYVGRAGIPAARPIRLGAAAPAPEPARAKSQAAPRSAKPARPAAKAARRSAKPVKAKAKPARARPKHAARRRARR
jgi:hypothetical protein